MCVVLPHIGNRFQLIKDGCMVQRSPPAARGSLRAWQYSSHRPVVKRVISSGNESLPFSRLKANPKSLVHSLMAGNIKEASRGAVAGPRLGANKVMC